MRTYWRNLRYWLNRLRHPRMGRPHPSTRSMVGTVACWAFGHPWFDGQFCGRCWEFYP